MQSDQFMADLPTKIAMLVYQGIFLLNPVKSHLLMAQVRKQVIIHVATFSSHLFFSLRDHPHL